MESVSKDEMYKCKADQLETNNKINTKLSLLNKGHENMASQIKELKKDTKESFEKIENLIKDGFEKFDKRFVTKIEHLQTAKKVDNIYKWVFWLITVVGGVIILAILNLIIK